MQIIAERIANLTDARYYAAMQVDWIGFDLGPTSAIGADQVKAFIEWIEGPLVFIDVSGRSQSEAKDLLEWIEPDGVLSVPNVLAGLEREYFRIAEVPEGGPANLAFVPDALVINTTGDEPLIKPKGAALWVRVYADTNRTAKWWPLDDAVMRSIKARCDGFLLPGSDEEKAGVKSFEDTDEIIEVLRN